MKEVSYINNLNAYVQIEKDRTAKRRIQVKAYWKKQKRQEKFSIFKRLLRKKN